MSQLEDDISTLADEAFTKKDAKAAIAIIGEVVGLGAVAYAGAVVISAMFGPGGVVVASAGAARALYAKLCMSYCDLPRDQRLVVAKLAKRMNGIWGDLT
ncbi:MAG: hypothetical protein NC548_39935 [Lachnospiraceae bacterium]|nr:hypothetical protein [Lachnospiraceae bacterium]